MAWIINICKRWVRDWRLRRQIMCENVKYWMKFYMACIAKGGLIVVAASFLFFQCSAENPPPTNDNPQPPPTNDNPQPPADEPVVADSDNDGLIEIKNAVMLNNIRYDLAGTSYKTSATQTTGDSSGCPVSGCNGYELTADIDLLSLLDADGNRVIDTTMVGIDKNADGDTTDNGEQVNVIDPTVDTSWVPIGDNSTDDDTTRFTGMFEGNNYTIANLWVNVSGSNAYTTTVSGVVTTVNIVVAGLFGMVGGAATIRNVGVISGSIYAAPASSDDSSSGGMVGTVASSLTITNSYFSGSGGVYSKGGSTAVSGGLVGTVASSLTITNSYFSGSGGVHSKGGSTAVSGGMAGLAPSLMITNSYFSGSGGVSSNGMMISVSGGIAGFTTSLTIINSYFGGSGSVSSDDGSLFKGSGGLVGLSVGLTSTDSYWNTSAPQNVAGASQSPRLSLGTDSMSTSDGLTLMQLQAITGTHPSGLPNGSTDNTKAWDLGTASQLPVIKLCVPTVDTSTTPPTTDWTTCASYGALLAGQR